MRIIIIFVDAVTFWLGPFLAAFALVTGGFFALIWAGVNNLRHMRFTVPGCLGLLLLGCLLIGLGNQAYVKLFLAPPPGCQGAVSQIRMDTSNCGLTVSAVRQEENILIDLKNESDLEMSYGAPSAGNDAIAAAGIGECLDLYYPDRTLGPRENVKFSCPDNNPTQSIDVCFGVVPLKFGQELKGEFDREIYFDLCTFIPVNGDEEIPPVESVRPRSDRSNQTIIQEATQISETGAVPESSRTVNVVFNVTVPDYTPTDRSVYIAGTLDLLDNNLPWWEPAGVKMTRVNDTQWTITLTGKESTQIEYKFTLGSWDFAEKDPFCDELANRKLILSFGSNGTQTVNISLQNWRNSNQFGGPCSN